MSKFKIGRTGKYPSLGFKWFRDQLDFINWSGQWARRDDERNEKDGDPTRRYRK